MEIADERILPQCFGGIDKEYNSHCGNKCEFTKECVQKCLGKKRREKL